MAYEPHTEAHDSSHQAARVPGSTDADQDYVPLFQRVSITGDDDTGGVSFTPSFPFI